MSDDSVEPIETYEQKKEKPWYIKWAFPIICVLVLIGNWLGYIDLSPENERTIRDIVNQSAAPVIGDLDARLTELEEMITGEEAAPEPDFASVQPQGLLDVQNLNFELTNKSAQIAGLQQQVQLYEAQVEELHRALRTAREAVDAAANMCLATMENTDAEIAAQRDDLAARLDRALGVQPAEGDLGQD